MKKIFSILMILIMSVPYTPCLGTFANTTPDDFLSNCLDEKIVWESSELQKTNLGRNINYNVLLKTSKPYEVTKEDGSKFFQKKIRAVGLFFKKKDEKNVINNEFEVTFSYDGTSAWIESDCNDIKSNIDTINKSKFKGSTCEKILMSDSQCIVSEQISLFKKKNNQTVKKWKDTDNFHIDAVCSPSGKINISSKDSRKVKSIVNEISNDKASLEDKVIKKVTEVDKQLVLGNDTSEANTNDAYSYVTRQMKILYTDLSGSVLSRVVIEANFRYNKVSGEVECLSTSHTNAFSSKNDEIKVYMRTGNQTKTLGGAYGEVKLSHSTGYLKENFEEKVIITCDSNGAITSEINY